MQVNLTFGAVTKFAQIFLDHQILGNMHVLSVLPCIQAHTQPCMMYFYVQILKLQCNTTDSETSIKGHF